jgi:hypothetical protein
MILRGHSRRLLRAQNTGKQAQIKLFPIHRLTGSGVVFQLNANICRSHLPDIQRGFLKRMQRQIQPLPPLDPEQKQRITFGKRRGKRRRMQQNRTGLRLGQQNIALRIQQMIGNL